ncbi:Gfo/Idh/MocA family protein [Paenibacillus sp. TAB 01]|uniref:Gfo/Idh/MocA family protein n=1 Tax=Paenibacillus sp. TAB 01 TaxID=3368988 RepID=UPI0037503E92
MRTLRAGVIGCGNHMYKFLWDRMKELPVTLEAACDIDEGRLSRFARFYGAVQTYTDYRRLIAESGVDILICAAPADVHYEACKLGLLTGKHVFVEKTPCLNAQQAEELKELQHRTGLSVMVGFNRRYATAYRMAKEIISRREFGGVLLYQAKYHAGAYPSEDYFYFNHVIHHLDLAEYLLGGVTITHAEKIKVTDRKVGINVTFVCETGTVGNIQSASFQHSTFPVERVELIGNERNVIVDNLKRLEYNRPGEPREHTGETVLADSGDALVWNINHGIRPDYSYYGYEAELRHFIEAAAAGWKPESGFDKAVRVMQLTDQIRHLF